MTGDTDTGLFFATNTVNIHAGGTTAHEFTASASTPKVPVRATNASASSPSYSFASDTNTGIYRSSADALAVATGGTNRAIFDSNGLTVKDRKGILLHDTDNSHGVTIKPPGTVSSNYTLTLPGDDGNNNQILKSDGSGNLSWTTVDTLASDAQFLKYQSTTNTTALTLSRNTWTDTGLAISNYTPQSSSSKIILTAYLNLFGKPNPDSAVGSQGKGDIRIIEGSSNVIGEIQHLHFGQSTNYEYHHYVAQKQWQFTFHVEYTNSSTSQKSFKVQLYEENGVIELNDGMEPDGLSYFTLMEVL